MFHASLLVVFSLFFNQASRNGVHCVFAPRSWSYEAEDSDISNNVSFATGVDGQRGSGYLALNNRGFLEWTNVNAFKGEGLYHIIVKYAVADKNGRKCKLFVNGQERGTLFFSYTGGFEEWKYERVKTFLHAGKNGIKIQAIGEGPHIDKFDLAFLEASASPDPTPAKPLTPVTLTTAPTSPTTSTTTTTTTTRNPNRPLQLKMFFARGMTWQETYESRAWCASCNFCVPDAEVRIVECNAVHIRQRWIYNDGMIISSAREDLCIELQYPSSRRVAMQPCDSSKDRQQWIGYDISKAKFQLRPKLYPDMCLTQEHHPKFGEDLRVYDCWLAEENDGTLTDPNDGTSYWVAGVWTGHDHFDEDVHEAP